MAQRTAFELRLAFGCGVGDESAKRANDIKIVGFVSGFRDFNMVRPLRVYKSAPVKLTCLYNCSFSVRMASYT
jgi:hypothetical protein